MRAFLWREDADSNQICISFKHAKKTWLSCATVIGAASALTSCAIARVLRAKRAYGDGVDAPLDFARIRPHAGNNCHEFRFARARLRVRAKLLSQPFEAGHSRLNFVFV